MDAFSSTVPRLLTFFERMRLTYRLLSMGLPAPGVWIPVLWSTGAVVSSSRIDRQSVKLVFESEKKQASVEVTIAKRRLTPE